ncbi:hypothetical protein MRX96_004247 [Rhipicephalus microplus]
MEYRGVQDHGFVSPLTFSKYDIVLTTYEVLKKELHYTNLPHVNSAESRSFRNPRKFLPTPSPLTALLWWRVCLDEAQMVEGTATKAAQMALKLSAVNRWCVTGTPIQKSMHDLYGLLLFLGEEPYNVKLWWNECLLMPYCHGDSEPLVAVLSRCFRRTIKENVLEQIGIPLPDSIFHTLNFSPVEEIFYERQAEQCAAAFREQVCKFPDHSIRNGTTGQALRFHWLAIEEESFNPFSSILEGARKTECVRMSYFYWIASLSSRQLNARTFSLCCMKDIKVFAAVKSAPASAFGGPIATSILRALWLNVLSVLRPEPRILSH